MTYTCKIDNLEFIDGVGIINYFKDTGHDKFKRKGKNNNMVLEVFLKPNKEYDANEVDDLVE